MSEEYTRPRGVPSDATARQQQQQQQQQEPPDFLMHAGSQLNRASHGVSEMAKKIPDGDSAAEVIELRLKLAAGYTELAAIQYGLPADDGEEYQ